MREDAKAQHRLQTEAEVQKERERRDLDRNLVKREDEAEIRLVNHKKLLANDALGIFEEPSDHESGGPTVRCSKCRQVTTQRLQPSRL